MQLTHRSRSGPDAEPEGRTGSGPAAQGASGSEDGTGTRAGTGSIAGARTAAGVPGRITWAAAFALNLLLLLAHNLKIFSKPIAENADFAANSLATIEAKHFTLLFGNYSRQGFRHPGPADFYVQAAGESLFRDVLRIVPAPWNGQLLAILILNAALLAGVVTIFRSWLPSWAATGFSMGASSALGGEPGTAGAWRASRPRTPSRGNRATANVTTTFFHNSADSQMNRSASASGPPAGAAS